MDVIGKLPDGTQAFVGAPPTTKPVVPTTPADSPAAGTPYKFLNGDSYDPATGVLTLAHPNDISTPTPSFTSPSLFNPPAAGGSTQPGSVAATPSGNGSMTTGNQNAPTLDSGGFSSSSMPFLQQQMNSVAANSSLATSAADANKQADEDAANASYQQAMAQIAQQEAQTQQEKAGATGNLNVNAGRYGSSVTNDTASAEYKAAIQSKYDTVFATLESAKSIAASAKTAALSKAAATQLQAQLQAAKDQMDEFMNIYKTGLDQQNTNAQLSISKQSLQEKTQQDLINNQQQTRQFMVDNGITSPYFSLDGGQTITDAVSSQSIDAATFKSMGGDISKVQAVTPPKKYAAGVLGEYQMYSDQLAASGGKPMDFLSYQKTLANAGRAVTNIFPGGDSGTKAIDNVKAIIAAHPNDWGGAAAAINQTLGNPSAATMYDSLLKQAYLLPASLSTISSSLPSNLTLQQWNQGLQKFQDQVKDYADPGTAADAYIKAIPKPGAKGGLQITPITPSQFNQNQ